MVLNLVNQYLVLGVRTGKPFLTFRCIYRRQTSFENIVTKGEIAQNKQFLLFATMFSTLSSNFTFIYTCYRDFLYFCLDILKVVSCRVVVWRKGLTLYAVTIPAFFSAIIKLIFSSKVQVAQQPFPSYIKSAADDCDNK